MWDEVDHFPTDEEYAELHRQFTAVDLTPEQIELIRVGIPCFPSNEDEKYVFAVHNVLSPWTREILRAFGSYYHWSDKDRSQAERFYFPALRAAIVLTRAEVVASLRETRRADVYPRLWDIVLLETFKSMLLALEGVGLQVLDAYEELDDLDDAVFKRRFEEEWRKAMEFRDEYGGFLARR